MKDLQKIIVEFKRIQKLGFIRSNRTNNTGIGKTFEDYLGVTENNKKDPDFAGFEVKSQRSETESYVTLFTKSPTHPKKANTWIRDTFGQPYEEYPNLKKIHTSFFVNRFNNFEGKYGFKLKIDDVNEKIFMQVKNLLNDEIVSEDVYWDFSAVPINKLENLFLVQGETKKIDGIEYFHYTKAEVFIGFKFEKFIEMLRKGKIMFDIRIGSYKDGKKKGKSHDHGSGFRIKRENFKELYELSSQIE